MTEKQEVNIHEMSLIDLAYQILKQDQERKEISFKAMFREVSDQLGLSDDEIKDKIVQFYTDLNIDGRFFCTGDNQWGLCEWYPFEKMEDDIVTVSKPKRKKAHSESDDFDLLEEDGDDIGFDEDDDFDDLDFDEEEVDMDEDELGLDDDLDLEEVDELDEGFILEDDNALDEEDDLDYDEEEDRDR